MLTVSLLSYATRGSAARWFQGGKLKLGGRQTLAYGHAPLETPAKCLERNAPKPLQP